MRSMRSLAPLPFALLVATAAFGCSDEKPKAEPAASTATAAGSAKSKINLRQPIGPQVKVDPGATKDYRIDVCLYGTLTLRQARDAYLASLGGAEPSDKKLPSFGGPANPPTANTTAPATTAAPGVTAKPAATPAATAKPTAAASAAPTGAAAAPMGSGSARVPPPVRPLDIAMRAPHERNARACSVAAGLKEPAMAELDGALQAFAPYAVDLAKDVATAQTYYQREEYKKDNFEKGKDLHKKMVEKFGKLDEQWDKLAAAVDAWRKGHAPDASKMEEGEKLASVVFEDTRAVLVAATGKKVDVDAFKTAVGKLEKSAEALKTYATAHAADPWGKMMNPSIDAFIRAAKENESKISDKGIPGETLLVMTNSFVSVVEAKYRALSRATTMKAQQNAGAAEAPKREEKKEEPKKEKEEEKEE